MLTRPDIEHTKERRLTKRGVLWLGLICDLKCKFCYDKAVKKSDKGWISVNDAIIALDKFRYYYGNKYIDFMGGEPTLHPHILDIVRYAAEIGLHPTIVTHGMNLASRNIVESFSEAGLHDFLISIHGIGDTARLIHGCGKNNFEKQMVALDNINACNMPFRINCTIIRDNIFQLEEIAYLASKNGSRVLNLLSFNPFFEWCGKLEIPFQVKYSEAVPFIMQAINKCNEFGVEVNVRYMPICQFPGYETHVYSTFQLPYDIHEWDYNSWFDQGHEGTPTSGWYMSASQSIRQKHDYVYVDACSRCATKTICDGFHSQYVARWGAMEAKSYLGNPITDPTHFIKNQIKITYRALPSKDNKTICPNTKAHLTLPKISNIAGHRLGLRKKT